MHPKPEIFEIRNPTVSNNLMRSCTKYALLLMPSMLPGIHNINDA